MFVINIWDPIMKGCITKTVGLIAFGISTSLVADEQSLIQSEKQKFSYTIGYQIGGQLLEQMKYKTWPNHLFKSSHLNLLASKH